MKKVIIALLVLTVCFSLFACGNEESKSAEATEAVESTESAFFSLEELVNDPEFQKIYTQDDDENFRFSVSASGNVFTFRMDVKKTYDDYEYLQNLTDKEISDKFGFVELQKLFKGYNFGDVTIDFKLYNGDGTLITERTFDPQ